MKRITALLLAIALILSLSGCIQKKNTFTFKNRDSSWSMEIPKEFVKDKEVNDDQQKALNTYFKTENGITLIINETKDEELEINEELIIEEIGIDPYIKVDRYDTIEIKDVGKAYGAVVKDNATGVAMLYYRLKHGDNAISFILHRKGSFTPEQEAKATAMISTFKGIKK